MARTTRTHQLMQTRARRRICEVLCEDLEFDIDDDHLAHWVRALVLQGVDLALVQAEASEVAKALRGIARRKS